MWEAGSVVAVPNVRITIGGPSMIENTLFVSHNVIRLHELHDCEDLARKGAWVMMIERRVTIVYIPWV